MSEQITINQGVNQLSNRDHRTIVYHYGALDRWLSTSPNDVVINSNNHTKISVGTKVKISDALFTKLVKLLTLVDRTHQAKGVGHVKRSISRIAEVLGYADRKGFYKVIKPLYEVGLVDFKEIKRNNEYIVDLYVYQYPVYADSDICDLLKFRNFSDRETNGFMLSKRGSEANKKKPEDKSTQVAEDKSTQVAEDKSTQVAEDKSTQVAEDKSTQSNNLISTNNLNSNNLISSKVSELNLDAKFINIVSDLVEEKKIDDDDLIINILEKCILCENPNKKYVVRIYDSLTKKSKQITTKMNTKKDKLPKSITQPQTHNDQKLSEDEIKRLESLLDF